MLESVAAAETPTGEVTVALFAGEQIVTVRFVVPGVQVAARAVEVKVETKNNANKALSRVRSRARSDDIPNSQR